MVQRLKGIAVEALRLNMRLYAAWLDASRDYLGALRDLAGRELAGAADAGTARPAAPAASARSAAAAATIPPVPPLVLAASAGGQASAAISVSNSTGQALAAEPVLSPQLAEAGLMIEPGRQNLAPGAAAVFTLRYTAAADSPAEGDIHGHVSIPHLGDRRIPVVLRCLRDSMVAPLPEPGEGAAPDKGMPA